MRDDEDLARSAKGIGMLADPVRRDLYHYVARQSGAVGREQAAADLGIALHTAKFHLDRLVEAGLLRAEFRRPPGRSGPGAGRPAKVYRRAPGEIAVLLPERRYDLAGELMAEAIDTAATTGEPVVQALHAAAADRGAALGRLAGPTDVAPADVVPAACSALAELGYEPRVEGAEITLVNCPFHALVAKHTDLVCGLNLALLGGLADVVGPGRLTARLDPAEGRCCVVLGTAGRSG